MRSSSRASSGIGAASSSTRRSTAMSSPPPYPAPSRTTSRAADCRPRLSPPASSPAVSDGEQPVRQREVGGGGLPGRHHREHDVLAGQAVALDRVALAGLAARPVDARAAGVGGRAALDVDDADLAVVAALVLLEQALERDRRGGARRRGGRARGPCRRRWRRPGWRWRRRRRRRRVRRSRRPGTSRRRRPPRTPRRLTWPRSRTSCPDPRPAVEPGRRAARGSRVGVDFERSNSHQVQEHTCASAYSRGAGTAPVSTRSSGRSSGRA